MIESIERRQNGTTIGTAYTVTSVSPSSVANGELAFVDRLSDEWEDSVNKLLAFRTFEDDWDGDGATAPQKVLVDAAIKWLLDFKRMRWVPPTSVYATVNGEISMEWRYANGEVTELEFSENGVTAREVTKYRSKSQYLSPI